MPLEARNPTATGALWPRDPMAGACLRGTSVLRGVCVGGALNIGWYCPGVDPARPDHADLDASWRCVS